MEISFDTNVREKELYKFSLNNMYRRITGLIWILFSIVVIFVTVYTWGRVDIMKSILMIVIAALYTIVNPIMSSDICNFLAIALEPSTRKSAPFINIIKPININNICVNIFITLLNIFMRVSFITVFTLTTYFDNILYLIKFVKNILSLKLR